MTINHHPGDETLLQLGSGTLEAGAALVVSVHVHVCDTCRQRLAGFEALGGAMLENMPPGSLVADSFGRTLERLNAGPTTPRTKRQPPKQPELGLDLPRAMRYSQVGPWRWLGPGVHWSKVRIAGSPESKVILIKGQAGVRLPAHGHNGLEFTQVLSGSLSDERGRYLPGDLDEADDEVDHQPVIGVESDCVCLAAIVGDTRLHGIWGRLLRPFVGF